MRKQETEGITPSEGHAEGDQSSFLFVSVLHYGLGSV